MPASFEVLSRRKLDGRWLDLRVSFEGRTFVAQALVFEEPSMFGIDEGRVSKLWIAEPEGHHTKRREVFNFDRGLDFDRAPAGLVAAVLAEVTR